MGYLEDGQSVEDRAAAEAAVEMAETRGWKSLATWVETQIRMETEAVVNGSSSWEQYQLSVGRLDAYRKVLSRPDEVVKAADTGDSQ